MVTRICVIFALFSAYFSGWAQPTTFQKTYTGPFNGLSAALQLSDGRLACSGSVINGLPLPNADASLLFFDANGVPGGGKQFSAAGDQLVYSIFRTSDGGFLLSGSTTEGGPGGTDMLLIKTDLLGNVLWSKAIGTALEETIAGLRALGQTPDGNYVLSGQAAGANGLNNTFVAKVNAATGTIVWSGLYPLNATAGSVGNDLLVDAAGDILVAGGTDTPEAATLLKINGNNGNVLFAKSYTTAGTVSRFYNISVNSSGQYVLTGRIRPSAATNNDVLWVCVNTAGNQVWARSLTLAGDEGEGETRQMADGTYIHVTSAATFGNGQQYMVTRLAANGSVTSVRTFGGANDDIARTVVPSTDGGVFVAGTSFVFPGPTDAKGFLIKTDLTGANVTCPSTAQTFNQSALNMTVANVATTRAIAGFTELDFSVTASNLALGQTVACADTPCSAATVNFTSTTVCVGNQTALVDQSTGVNINATYAWDVDGNGTTDYTTFGNVLHTYPAAGTYNCVLTITNPVGCVGSITKQVIVNPKPTLSVSSTQNPLCENNTATLTASGAATYNWQPGNQNGASISVSPTITTIYTITGTSASGCTNSIEYTLEVAEPVNLNITASEPIINGGIKICKGRSVDLAVSGAIAFVWQPGNIQSSAITVIPDFTTTYTVVGTATSGCTASATMTITVQEAFTTASTSKSTICPNEPTQLTSTGVTNNYVWLPGNLSGKTVTVSPSVSTTYTVKYFDPDGCTAVDSVRITVLNGTSVSSSVSQASICPGGSTTLTATGPVVSYVWNPGNINNAVATVSPAITTTYTVTGTAANGCTATSTQTVTVQPFLPISVTPQNPIQCFGFNTNLTASGASTYLWNPAPVSGQGTANVTVSPLFTTSYTVVGTDASGCTGSTVVTVTVQQGAAVTASAGQSSVCQNAAVQLTASGSLTYVWTPGNLSGQSVVVNPPNTTTYTVVGTDANGCTNSATVTVNTIAAPNVAINANPSSICTAGGSTTLTASGAQNYVWLNTGTPGATLTVSPTVQTTYTVVGSAANGCTASATVTINVGSGPTLTASASPTSICPGESSTLTVSGATTYVWNPGNLSGASVSVTPPSTRTYTVTGTTAQGCASTATVTVTVKAVPNITVTSSSASNTACNGGSVTLTASGGSSYSWSTGQTGASIVVTPTVQTTYTVTGTGANACSNTATITIGVQNATVTVTAGANTICAGGSTTLTASGAATYSWLPGSLSGATVTVSPASTTTYTVTGTTAQGCTATATRTITVSNPTITATAAPASICVGGSSTLTAAGGATYNWSTGQSGASISVSPAVTTTYTVTGSNALGCSNTATVTVTVTNNPTINISASNTTVCSGAAVQLTASGATTYTWAPGGLTGASVSVNPVVATTYTVTGVGAGGCSSTATIAIGVSTNPTVSVSANANNVCPGAAVQLTASGAATYSWQPGGQNTAVVTVNPLTTTVYTVTGTAANGCSSTATLQVDVKLINIQASVTNPTICEGSSTTLIGSGGSNYTWAPATGLSSTVGSPVTASPTATTTYTLTAVAQGCTVTSTVTLNVNPKPALVINSSVPVLCTGSGSATLTASGAVSYQWQPGGSTNASITVNPVSNTTYTVTGTSAAGCTATQTFTLNVNTTPTVSITPSGSNTICIGQSLTLTGNGAAAYSWAPGNLTGNSINVTPNATTTYTVTGTTNGCSATATLTVTVNGTQVTATANKTTICVGESVTLTAANSANYIWQPMGNAGATQVVSPTQTTTYTVSGFTAGCPTSATVTITVNPLPTVSVTSSDADNTLCPGQSSTLTASGAASYLWAPGGQVTATINVSPANTTTYTVTGTDGNGCSATATITITRQANPSVIAGAGATTICAGSSTQLVAGGAQTYLWQPGNHNGAIFNVTPAATTTYTVTGTDAAGCSATATTTVTVNQPTVTATASAAQSCGGEAVTLTATGAVDYTWQPGGLNGDVVSVTPSATTTYTVIGADAGGCTNTATVTVAFANVPTVSVVSTAAEICAGQSVTLTASGAVSYLWSPTNDATPSITDSPTQTTTYTVVGTGANGCTTSATITVTVNQLPVLNITSSAIAYCGSQPVELTVSGAVSYEWQPGGFTTETISVTPTVTTTYTVTAIDEKGCQNTATVTVNFEPPVATATANNASLCQGEFVTLNASASSAATVLWQPGNFAGTFYTLAPNVSTTYTLYAFRDGCVDSTTIDIEVKPLPVVTATQSINTICANESVILKAFGADSYSWTPTTGLSSATGDSVVATPTVTTTYTVAGMVNGCTTTVELTVTVTALPVVELTGILPVYCKNSGPVTVVGSPVAQAPAVGVFYINGVQVSDPSFNPDTLPIDLPIIVRYEYTNENGCFNFVEKTFIVNKLDVSFGQLADFYCVNNTPFQLPNPQPPGGSLYLNDVLQPNLTITPGALPQDSPVRVKYVYTDASIGCTDSMVRILTIKTFPDVTLTLDPSEAPYCPDRGATIFAPLKPEYEYLWNNGATTPSINVKVSGDYFVTIIDASTPTRCAINSDTVRIDIVAAPSNPTIAVEGDLDVCDGDSTKLTALPEGFLYVWLRNGVAVTSSPSPSNVFYPKASGNYTVEIIEPLCNNVATSAVPVTVQVYALPQARFVASTIKVGTYEPVTFTDISLPDSVLQTPLNGRLWEFGDGASSNDSVAVHAFKGAGDYPVTLYVQNENGCTDTMIVMINVVDFNNILIPTAFSPNDDNLNDELIIYTHGIESFEIIFFDHWQSEVWRSNDKNLFWRGESRVDGKKVPQGVYFYRVIAKTFAGYTIDKGGNVTVLY